MHLRLLSDPKRTGDSTGAMYQSDDEDDDDEEGSDSSDDDDDDDEADGANTGMQLEGAYDPADYENLPVTPEIKDLFGYITKYIPQVRLCHDLMAFYESLHDDSLHDNFFWRSL